MQSWWIADDNLSVWIIILPLTSWFEPFKASQAMSRAGRNTCRGEILVVLYHKLSNIIQLKTSDETQIEHYSSNQFMQTKFQRVPQRIKDPKNHVLLVFSISVCCKLHNKLLHNLVRF